MSGVLAPGKRLPSLSEFVEEYHVSVGTVRQALSVLENEGLVERVHGSGTFVRPPALPDIEPSSNAEKRLGLVLTHHSDQLNMEILIGVERAAKSRGYQVIFTFAEEHIEQQRRDIERLCKDGMDGLIIFPVGENAEEEGIVKLQHDGVPFVLVDRHFPELETNYVITDNFTGGYRATEHLLILGHKTVGFIYPANSSLRTTSVAERLRGYREALHDYGVPVDESLIYQRAAHSANSYDDYLADENIPGAIFVCTDVEALKVIKTIQQLGKRIPQDVALVGFDDLNFAAHLNPALTTIVQPRIEIGFQAVNVLMDIIEGRQLVKPTRLVLPIHLIVRESCGARMRVQKNIAKAQ